MTALVSLPIVLPLLGAALAVGFGHWRGVQRAISVATLGVVTTTSVALLVRVDRDGMIALGAGEWPTPMGIGLVADRFAVIMLVVSMMTLASVLLYAIGESGAERRHDAFHPTYLVLTAGIAMAFLTGDLFNLFVAFEVMLMASYVLITLGGRREQVRTGMTYIVISLIASTVFLIALAFIHATTGTVNMADLHGRIAELPDGIRSGLAVLLIVVFGIKAAVFPLFFWLPDSYPEAPTPITAVFAGLLTKVGVYAIIRSQTVLFPPETRPGGLLLWIAGLTMVVGVLGAISRNDIKRLLSFHIISQIGYMIMGLGLFTVAGLAGAVIFIVHQIVVKTVLFLAGGLVEHRTGTGRLDRLSGMARMEPLVGVLFLLSALSLAGVPPFSGFIAKLALVEAGIESRQWAIVVVSLLVSLLTLYSMNKIWTNAFWGPVAVEEPVDGHGSEHVRASTPAPASPADTIGAASVGARTMVTTTITEPDSSTAVPTRRTGGSWPLMVGATGLLVALSIALAVWGGPLYDLSERTATDLMDPSGYVEEVLRP